MNTLLSNGQKGHLGAFSSWLPYLSSSFPKNCKDRGAKIEHTSFFYAFLKVRLLLSLFGISNPEKS